MNDFPAVCEWASSHVRPNDALFASYETEDVLDSLILRGFRLVEQGVGPENLAKLVGWFRCKKWDRIDYRCERTPNWNIKEASDYFSQQARSLTFAGRTVGAYVLDCRI